MEDVNRASRAASLSLVEASIIFCMERSSIAVESVGNLEAGEKRLLEEMLGRPLQEDQQVFLMVLSPGADPDEESRRQARVGLEAVFQKTTAYAVEQGASENEIDAAIRDAAEQVRRGTD